MAIVPKIKANYCIIGLLIAFLLGYAVAGCQGGAKLQYYRNRADDINNQLRKTQSELGELKSTVTNVENGIDEATRTASNIGTGIANAKKSTEQAQAGVENAEQSVTNGGNLVDECLSILRGIQERGRTQD